MKDYTENFGGPTYVRGMFSPCGRGTPLFKGNSTTQSTAATSNEVTDQRVAASEGSVSAGANSAINIQSTDADAIARIAASSNDTVKDAIGENADVSKSAISGGVAQTRAALDFGTDAVTAVRGTSRDALDFGESILGTALNNSRAVQQDTNNLIRSTNEAFTQKLAANAGIAESSVVDNITKYVTIGATVLGLAITIYSFRDKKA